MTALRVVVFLRNMTLLTAGAFIGTHHVVYGLCLCAVAGALEFVADEVRP